MKKIGIFGGTFDPPHNGHLLMANEVLYQAGLDEIWFMPNQIPPHKQNEDYTDSFHRVEMLKLACRIQYRWGRLREVINEGIRQAHL